MSDPTQLGYGVTHPAGGTSQGSMDPLLPNEREEQDEGAVEEYDKDGRPRKRDFFRLGKKAGEDKKNSPKSMGDPATTSTAPVPTAGGLRAVSPLAGPFPMGSTGSPSHTNLISSPASPGRQRLHSASPRALSPSTSQIFERNVQEDVVPPQASPQIPSHIITENHIPPALDASSEAITDSRLDPDTVEIVTHANHQPAAVALTGTADPSMSSSIHDDLLPPVPRHDTDNVSNYGSLDVGDVRRLSFISFADVVHAEQEHGEQRRDSSTISSLAGHPALAAPRSPSPMRSPTSSHALGTSPPTSVSSPNKHHENSPSRGVRVAGSPLPVQSGAPGSSELNIETMRQALRKTASGDLSGFRSGSTSAVGIDN